MKVVYFTDTMLPNMDGVVRTYCNLIDTLETENIDYKFYSPFKPSKEIIWHKKIRQVSYVPFFLYTDYRVTIPHINRLYPELDSYNPDLIHVVSPTLHGIYGLRYAQRRGIHAVTCYHTNFIDYFSYYGFAKFETFGWQYLKWFYNQFDKVYAPSNSSINELRKHGINNHTELWQRGIDLDKFSPEYRSDDLRQSIGAKDIPILLFVGRLVKEKDIDDLIDVVSILKKQRYDFKLVVVGDGPARNEMEEKLPFAHFTGYLSSTELSVWYASSDLFVFPSTTETFGNVILEAFASGLPAIVVNKGGCADLVTPRVNGYIANPHDPSDFATKISFFLDSKSDINHFSIAAIETAQNYNWNVINKNLIDSYKKLVFYKN